MVHSEISGEELHIRDQISIDISPANESLVYSIREKMETISSSTCIYRVPEVLVNKNRNAFSPYKLSIGPFHHGKPALSSMEDHKWRYLHSILSRKPNIEVSLDRCVKAIKDLENRARNYYSEHINLTSDNFVQMLLVDASFIIELFLKYVLKSVRHRNDPIFSTPGMLFELRSDMVLLENQIPIFVLQILFQILPVPRQCTYTFNELAFRFFKNMISGEEQLVHDKFSQEANHLLDSIHHCFVPTLAKIESKAGASQKSLDSAANLLKIGIKLKKTTTGTLLDIKFNNGVFEIPPLKVNQSTETLFRNLIAFEHCHFDSTQQVKSYALFMGCLINSDEDVNLLDQHEILNNCLGSEKEVSDIFKKICQGLKLKENYYAGIYEQVDEYQRTNWHVQWKKLKHRYLKTPISLVVCIVAIIVLVLTFVASFFSVLSFSLRRFNEA